MQVNFYSEKLVFYKFYLLTLMLIFIISYEIFFLKNCQKQYILR